MVKIRLYWKAELIVEMSLPVFNDICEVCPWPLKTDKVHLLLRYCFSEAA